jgi:hypothetical protein
MLVREKAARRKCGADGTRKILRRPFGSGGIHKRN